jgi:hypothetical protein
VTRPSVIASTLTLGLAALLTLGAGVASAAAEDVPAAPAATEEILSTEGDPVAKETPDPEEGETRTLVLSPEDAVVKPGVPISFEVTVLDEEGGVPLDPQPELDLHFFTDAGGDVFDGNTLTAHSDGPRAVMVTSPGQYGVTELWVIGDPVELAIAPSATSVGKGGSLSFTVTGKDRWGTAIDGSDAVLTSSVPTDVITGMNVTFPTASPHTITATLGGMTATVTVEVVGAPKAALAETGFDGLPFAAVGGLLMLGGILAVVFATRRCRARG